MPINTGLDFLQIKATTRHGSAQYGQASDGTGAENNLAKFAADGSLTDSGISGTGIVSLSGGGSIYAQTPVGTQDGTNRTFTLDYTLASPYTWLSINGVLQKPPANGKLTNPDPDYTVSGNTVTFTVAPAATDWIYIWYVVNTTTFASPIGSTPALLSVWTAFLSPSGNVHSIPTIELTPSVSMGGSSIPVQFLTQPLYSERQLIYSWNLPTAATLGQIPGTNVRFQLLGSILSSGELNQLQIFDVSLTVTTSAGIPVVFRPTTWSFSSGQDDIGIWEPNTNFATPDQIVDSNGNVQEAVNTGMSAASSPRWATTTGAQTIETTGLTWSCLGPQTSVTGQIDSPTNAYDNDSFPPATCATLTQSTWGGLVSDGWFQVTF